MTVTKKKLIEVALPLEAINKFAQEENNIHTGMPSNLHTWWSRKPLGVARAVLFSSLVDDPQGYLGIEEASRKREKLLTLVSRLARPDCPNDEKLLEEARIEIAKCTEGQTPSFWDPFCGGGSLPLEALRLGLPSKGSDLNPVAVFITRVLISIAPRQGFHPPVNPESHATLLATGPRFEGLRNDVEYYSSVIRTKLQARIGCSYPDATISDEFQRKQAQVAAWIWARTVICPNPACQALAPLVNKFWLSTHVGNEAYVIPVYNQERSKFEYRISTEGQAPEGTVKQTGAVCLACGNAIPFEHIQNEGVSGRIGYDMMAMAVEGKGRRLYVEPKPIDLAAAEECKPIWEPDSVLPESALGFRVQKYGITRHRDFFTKRQMLALSCIAEEIAEIRDDIIRDSKGDTDYADLVHAFLALSLSRLAQTNNTLVRWLVRTSGTSKGTPTFDRPIVPMVWEFSEGNIFGRSVGSWNAAVKNPLTALNSVPASSVCGEAIQHDASQRMNETGNMVISTDPPYFDAIGYADLSDFFYIWLRKALAKVHTDIFNTLLVPKNMDLTNDLGKKHISKNAATKSFLNKLNASFKTIRDGANDNIPVTIYYAFQQKETMTSSSPGNEPSIVSTGWETLLEALILSGFCITGTWPLRTEAATRLRANRANALASSIVLVCRPRSESAPLATRREFLSSMQKELPAALKTLQQGAIAPVDLAQAAIGPGMGVFSRYAKVLEADGTSMSVRTALGLINQALGEFLSEQEGEFDADTRWALAWFQQFAFGEGPYGDAETLCNAKNTSVAGLVEAGFLWAKGGKARLLRREELHADWDPKTDKRLTIWEIGQHLIRTLQTEGEQAASEILRKLGSGLAENVLVLTYRLHSICDQKKWTEEAFACNALAASWKEIVRMAGKAPAEQSQLF